MTDLRPVDRMLTGISGFDELSLGGLPAGRSTLVSGTTGSGKTLLAVEFLARGILRFGEPGVFVTFEETPADIRRNAASLGFPIGQWERDVAWAFVDCSADIAEEAPIIGNYDFRALTTRIEHAISRLGARRLSLDSLGAVFTRFADTAIVRHELQRLAAILAGREVTSVITGERIHEYDGVSRNGVEEFVLDNVISLRNVLTDGRRHRTIEIVKFRGAPHRTGEWLFTIDARDGLLVMPLAALTAPGPAPLAPRARVSSGIAELDRMCGGGFFEDAIVLLTGPGGAGKTLAAMSFLAAGLAAGELCLACTFDESREQVLRNAAGRGIDLGAAVESGTLRIVSEYPETTSLEDHFLRIRRVIEEFGPRRLVIDALSALERIAPPRALSDFVIALGAVVRPRMITTLLTSAPAERFTSQLSKSIAGDIAGLTDVTIALRYFERHGQVQRAIAVIRTRGTDHDSTVRQVSVDHAGLRIGEPVPDAVHILPGSSPTPARRWQSGHAEDSPPDD